MSFYLLVFVAGFIAVSLWSFWIVVRPARINVGLKPGHYKLPAEEITIISQDNLKLSGWLIPRKDNQPSGGSGEPAVILLHGYPAEKGDMLDIAQELSPRFTTLLMDLRYFGASEGRYTTLGWRERDDLKKTVDFLESRGFGPVGVFGFSLGGAIGLMTAAEDERIRAVAAYAAMADLKMLGRDAYAALWLLKYPLVKLMTLWGRLFLGGDITAPSPLDAAGTINVPVLLIYSRKDEQIPFYHAEIFQKALNRNRRAEFYFLERGRHGELPLDFDKRLLEFFMKNL